MEFLRAEANGRFAGQLRTLLMQEWGGVQVVVHGERYDLTGCDAFLCVEGDTVLGALHYTLRGGEGEILSLFSRREHEGIGLALMRMVARECRARGAHTLRVVTTNDNARAFRFYQQYGMELTAVRFNQVDDVSRPMKPAIPLTGCDGIPIRHELEFSMDL